MSEQIDAIRTQIPDDQPDWTENIAWSMCDPVAGVSLFGHLGRMQPDRTIWEGLSLIYLPDGTSFVNRSLGVSVAEARNREYHYEPLIPGRRWHFRFDGVAQRVRTADLRRRPVGDEAFEQASYDLLFEAVQPLFNMHHSDATSERMHLEQGGRLRGTLSAGGRRFDIDCVAYRDHSVSRRTFTTLDSETWAHCVFPGGRVYSLLEVERSGRRLQEGHVYLANQLQHARPVVIPELADTAGNPSRGVLAIESASGRHDIEWQTIEASYTPFQLLRPVGMRPGIDHSDPTHVVVLECPTRFVWDGEIGYGWLERSRPLSQLRD